MMWRHARHRAIFIDGEKRAAVCVAQSRLSFIAACFILVYLVIGARLVDLSVVQGNMLRFDLAVEQDQGALNVPKIAQRRGDVYDRNGFLVATTLKTPSLYVDPYLVLDEEALLTDLAGVIPDLDLEKAVRAVTAKNRFGWVHHSITPEQQQRILEIGDPSLGFEYEYKRFYPQSALFTHMLGYTDRDGLGLAGVERSYDDVLSAGNDVHLTMDLRLQHIVRREVSRAMSEFTAKAGAGVVMDAKTGEVLAAVSLPDFDLNDAGDATDMQKFNRLSLGVYELGSMFKIFSTAALLEQERVPMSYTFDARKPIKVGWYTINDYHAQKRILTVPEIFMHSSNIGSALMGQMVGGDNLRAFYKDLGLIDRMDFDIKEVGHILVPKAPWSDSTTMTASYGHGLSTTPVQMCAGVATIVNGGFSVRPTLVKRDQPARFKNDVRVVSEETSASMRKLLRLVVTEGTGRKADAQGYALGGKTGTAEKSVNGKYRRDKLISSFVGAFPIDDPKYVVMVMVDEPNGNKQSYGYATAGWVAAPAVSRIVSGIASVMGMPADQYDPALDISAELLPFVHDKKKKGVKKLASY